MPWTSPKGAHLSIAAATPTIPWSDLISSLLPNGRGLVYTVSGPSDDYTPAGVLKQSFVSGLYALGQSSGYIAPPGTDPTADLTNWYVQDSAFPGPYENDPQFGALVDQFKFKGAWYLLNGAGPGGPDTEAPAPMLLSNGFTDDLFPVDETVRYYNLERSLFPGDPVALTYLDYGHMRGQNKQADVDFLRAQIQAWLDHYVLQTGPDPGQNVTALTQTCPASAPRAARSSPAPSSAWPLGSCPTPQARRRRSCPRRATHRSPRRSTPSRAAARARPPAPPTSPASPPTACRRPPARATR